MEKDNIKVHVLTARTGLGHIIEAYAVAKMISGSQKYNVELRNFTDPEVSGKLVHIIWDTIVAPAYEAMQRRGMVDKGNSGFQRRILDWMLEKATETLKKSWVSRHCGKDMGKDV